MKDYKIINKKLDVNKFSPQKLNISFSGNILCATSIPFPNKKIYVLTDNDKFYVIENNNISKPQVFELKSDILNSGKLNAKSIKFQTDSLESQIWTDKKGNHVIIKYKRICFYYNPNMQNKIEELNLIIFGNTLVQPYAVVFNEDKVTEKDTGIFLLADYNSSIFEVQFFLSEKKEMMRLRFGEILRLKPDKRKNQVSENDFKLNFFEMDKDDRIIDFKLITQKDTILLLAITKNLLFQFYGQKDFRAVFNTYDLEIGNISKAVKKFFPQKQKANQAKIVKKLKNGEKIEVMRIEMEEREESTFSRIQLLNKENKEEFDSFGFMTDCGYIIAEINKDLKPQNKFNVFKYYKFDKETKEKAEIIHQKMPKAVCESNFNRFFLYKDYLVVQNKLTNTIKQNEQLQLDLIDIFYNEDSIIIYNKKNIYKITLDNENENLFEDYIQKGDYKTALLLKKDDSLLRPSLHKLYADNLFEKKQYLQAAIEYAFSNEIFEHVCIKFLKINNTVGLIRYIILIMQFRLNHIKKEEKNKDKKEEGETNVETNENNKEQFIERFLLHTWILELLAEKLENEKNDELVKEIKEITRYEKIGSKYINSNLLYNILKLFNKQDELIVFATLKKDYETIIKSLIIKKNVDLALEQFNLLLAGDEGELDKKLKKFFYKYGSILIKENIGKTIDSLTQYFRPENPEELIRILISPNLKSITEEENNFKIVMKYIKDLIKKPSKNKDKDKDKELNLSNYQNLHNLYILLVSESKFGTYKESFLRELKTIIDIFTENQKYNIKGKITDKIFFDLNFAKKIFKEKEDRKSKEILCLIYFLLNQYLDSIDFAIENNFEELLLYLTKNILEEKFRKKIWLKIFQYEKSKHGLTKAKEIIEKSENIIKIEDVIPLMSDNEKLNDLKEELTKCIEYSEESVIKLNNEIREFNEANNLINKDIDFSEKKAFKKKFTDLRCSKCNKNINNGKNTKFYLFPCQHIFDLQCLIDIYMEFSTYKIGDKKYAEKMGVIKDISGKIKKMEEKKNRALMGKDEFLNEEEFLLNITKKQLYDYLNDECLLCGQEMIDSTQIDFGNDEKFEWDLLY